MQCITQFFLFDICKFKEWLIIFYIERAINFDWLIICKNLLTTKKYAFSKYKFYIISLSCYDYTKIVLMTTAAPSLTDEWTAIKIIASMWIETCKSNIVWILQQLNSYVTQFIRQMT